MTNKTEAAEAVYRIGAVARLTGLSANTIRTWERRHGAVEPRRTPRGGRLYLDADVQRLLMLKELTENGEAISTLAELDASALAERLQGARRVSARNGGRLRVALLHRNLGPTLADDHFGASHWDVCVDAATVASFVAATASSRSIDAAILDLSLLGPVPEAAVEQCMDAASTNVALVTYHFAARKQLDRLTAAGARVVRAPVDVGELRRLIRDQMFAPHLSARSVSTEHAIPPASPRFSEHQLYRLRATQPNVDCECPHHLAELVESLVSFERYSASCAARSSKDRELHRTLERGTARARLLIEDLLDVVVRHEGIVL